MSAEKKGELEDAWSELRKRPTENPVALENRTLHEKLVWLQTAIFTLTKHQYRNASEYSSLGPRMTIFARSKDEDKVVVLADVIWVVLLEMKGPAKPFQFVVEGATADDAVRAAIFRMREILEDSVNSRDEKRENLLDQAHQMEADIKEIREVLDDF